MFTQAARSDHPRKRSDSSQPVADAQGKTALPRTAHDVGTGGVSMQPTDDAARLIWEKFTDSDGMCRYHGHLSQRLNRVSELLAAGTVGAASGLVPTLLSRLRDRVPATAAAAVAARSADIRRRLGGVGVDWDALWSRMYALAMTRSCRRSGAPWCDTGRRLLDEPRSSCPSRSRWRGAANGRRTRSGRSGMPRAERRQPEHMAQERRLPTQDRPVSFLRPARSPDATQGKTWATRADRGPAHGSPGPAGRLLRNLPANSHIVGAPTGGGGEEFMQRKEQFGFDYR